MPKFTSLAFCLTLLAGAAAAEGMNMDHSAHATPGAAPSTAAFQAADAAMHAAMAIDYSGDPDVDFVRGMIGHHQGAIDMAKIELQYGADPKIRALAEAIIEAQTAEIAELRGWLAEHGQ